MSHENGPKWSGAGNVSYVAHSLNPVVVYLNRAHYNVAKLAYSYKKKVGP